MAEQVYRVCVYKPATRGGGGSKQARGAGFEERQRGEPLATRVECTLTRAECTLTRVECTLARVECTQVKNSGSVLQQSNRFNPFKSV